VIVLAAVALALAAVPAVLFWINLRLYRAPPPVPLSAGPLPAVSVLIPARNEERSIHAAVGSALASRSAAVEVVVLDDRSQDSTAKVVEDIASRDDRVRLLRGLPLPPGWCGKQHACAVLASEAHYPLLAFLDADVRLAPDGLARMVAFLQASGADLVSGIPRQETGTFLERLVIPLIHFVLLGFLPLWRMRRRRHPAYAAGCGQLFLARRDAYERAGGHGAIRASLHDGITLPRAFRRAGLKSDLCDATDVAACRMYRSAAELWHGLAKNATEGLGHPRMIVPATLLLLGGGVLPLGLALAAPRLPPAAAALALAATVLLYSPRLAGMRRFRQSALGAVLHPLGVTALVAIQWYALLRAKLGRPAAWKGRLYRAEARARGTRFAS
jgi:Glycosyl transferase family 2